MPSTSKKQAKTMTAACKNAKFRKKVNIPKKVACKFHGADKGKYHESLGIDEDAFFTDLPKKDSDLVSRKSKDRDLRQSAFEVKLYKQEVIGEKVDGRVKWREKVSPIAAKENLSYKKAMQAQVAFEARARSLGRRAALKEDGENGWTDYFVRIQEVDIPSKEKDVEIRKKESEFKRQNEEPSKSKTKRTLKRRNKPTPEDYAKVFEAVGASKFMRVGKHLIELQADWIMEGDHKMPQWDIFVDGRPVGSIIQKKDRFMTEEEDMESIEEAISYLIDKNAGGIHFKHGNPKADRLRYLAGIRKDL